MFLEKYRNKRRLGKGAYGNVFLVEDITDNNKLYALKIIEVKYIGQQKLEHKFRQYLNGEIQCMKTMNSPHILKLFKIIQVEEEKRVYLLIEYCDGGDLINCQAKFENAVFPMKKAVQIAAQIIVGLEQLHQRGFLHRDIKSQNILLSNETGKEVYKLADFGFSKKRSNISGSVLGTERFISPEILFSQSKNQSYGFEVDMWAFGVLFYFMLNMEYPFNVNARVHYFNLQKAAFLLQLAQRFSYKKAIEKSKKKIMQNCTPDMQDLFKKIFQIIPAQRITFSQIREHPVFAEHFSEVSASCRDTYQQRQPSKRQFKRETLQQSVIGNAKSQIKAGKRQEDVRQEDHFFEKKSIIKVKDFSYPQEKEILERKKEQIEFLKTNAEDFAQSGGLLNEFEVLMISYNIHKYYVILMRLFKETLNVDKLNAKYPGLKWNQFIKTAEFKKIYKEVEEEINKMEVSFSDLYDLCNINIAEINKINSSFAAAFKDKIVQTGFDGAFKDSYRNSTNHIFSVLRKQMKKSKGKKISYIMAICMISHAFNQLFDDQKNIGFIFKEYFAETKKPVEKIDYSELREWMSKSKEISLDRVGKAIIQSFFNH